MHVETMQWTRSDIERSEWGPGPWDGEPDKKQWQDAATGLACLAHRHPTLGHWCGYVGVPIGHAWHGKEEEAVEPRPSVHGGLTFSGKCQPESDPSRGICHVADGEVWWFGFDFAHWGDMSPGLGRGSHRLDSEDVYKPLGYVEQQCAELAKQIAAV